MNDQTNQVPLTGTGVGLLLSYRPFAIEAIDSSSSATLSLEYPFHYLQGGSDQLNYFGISVASPAVSEVLSFRTSFLRGSKLETDC